MNQQPEPVVPDVTFLPADPPPRANPYLDYLEEALRATGLVIGSHSEGFRWRHLLFSRRLPLVYHLHWLNALHTGGKPWQTLLLSIGYLAKLLVLRLRGRRIVWTVHNLLPHYRATLADRLCHLATARLAHALIVHNEAARDVVQQVYRPQHVPLVAFMGRYEARYGAKAPREESRARLHLPPEPLVFLIFGQLRANKRIDRLVECFAELDPKRFLLLICGTRASKDALNECREQIAHASQIVLREGFFPDEDVRFLFGAADAFLFTGDEILSTSSVVLAMSYGLPILARRLRCLEGVVPEGARIEFDPNDKAQALETLRALDRQALVTRGAEGLRAISTRTWEAMAQVHRQAYGFE